MDTNFKRNLLIGFSASLLILLASSTASFVSIRNLLNAADLVAHTNEVIREMEDINIAMVDAETGQRGYLLTHDKAFLDPYINSQTRAKASLETLKRLTGDNVEQQSSLKTLTDLIDERFRYLQITIEQKEDSGAVNSENLRYGRDIMTNIREVMATMRTREQELLQSRTETLNQFSSYTPVLIISAAMIALFITAVFYAKVRSDFDHRLQLQKALEDKDAEITNRINIIKGVAEQISQGTYTIRIDDLAADELGSVAGSLNKMAQSLEYSFDLLSEKEWLQTGLAQLNDVIIGEKTVESLSSDIINFLAHYTNSHAGVFYVCERDELHATAGFAYLPDKTRKVFKFNEGLVGQAVASGKLMELQDIPSENIYISFIGGEAKPRHVIALPVLDGYSIKGAVELASLDVFSPRQIEFLKSAAHNIGVALSTAQNRKKLQELLEETQAQAEELKSQQTELENVNSELEVQAEKLQASEEELKVQQEELKQANQELEERSRLLEERNQLISERNREIQSTADQLAQSTRYKSEFLANMSHELRTPLNSILLLSRLMGENQSKNLTPEQVEYAKVIQSSGNGLLSLIDEILDLSKIESGKMQLEYQSCSLKDIVRDMEAMFSPVAREKGVVFKTNVHSDAKEVIETDRLRLEQILRNLLSNALKFTAQGHVTLDISPLPDDQSFIQFKVTDTGIGIPFEKQHLIFDAFQQADGSTRRKYGGTGLGLSISRELTKLLGGEIRLVSELNKGSEFTVVIPTYKISSPKKLADTVPVNVVEEALPEVEPLPPHQKYVSETIPESLPDDRKMIKDGDKVILIVEDDVNFAKSLLEYTRKRGYKGVVSVRGDEAVPLAKQFTPLGILLDIQLPVRSGWEVMEDLKKDSQTRHIPVHIMSSYQVKKESLMKGAVDFINKPVAFEQIQDVFKKIEYVLSHHPKKVLIVEENRKHAKALAYFLAAYDINLEISNDVSTVVDSLKKSDTDCVILDMGIPDQKAYDTLEEVKRTPGFENLPVIIFTGKSLSQAEELKIKQYADSIVVKTAHSYKRVLDEVSLFLHLMEGDDEDRSLRKKPAGLGALDEVLKNKTVLIADDDMRNIFSMTKVLEKYQMTVLAAVDGKDALRQLNSNPHVDIILMDMMMPEMDGYESTAAIRKDKRFKNIPVIAVTAKAMMGDRAKCISAGASDYITKPVDIDQLLSLLRVWLYEK